VQGTPYASQLHIIHGDFMKARSAGGPAAALGVLPRVLQRGGGSEAARVRGAALRVE